MTKSFDEIVGTYSQPVPEWEVTVNGTDYTKNIELIEFEDQINNPVEFTVKLSGTGGESIPEDAEVVIKKGGGELFRGTVQQANPDFLQDFTLKGAGYPAELEGDSTEIVKNANGVSNPFQGSTVTEVVNTLVDDTSTGTNTSRTFSTSFDLNNTLNVEDFRANKTQLEDVNRLVGEFNIEWYATYDGSNNPVFNVTDQLLTTDSNDEPVETITLYGDSQTAEKVNQNVNRKKGDFDGVKVRGYGDGDDQVTATAGSIGKGNRTLIYTDKTVISDSQAQQRADKLNSSKTINWQEIEVKPNNPNRLYSIGDQLKVEAEDALLDDKYRVVKAYFKIWPGENQFESKLNLSNKPQTFLSEFKTEKAKREGQTDHSQGNRNTINESNKDLADSNNSTKLEFNIPSRFTDDVTGKDRTEQVRLDFVVDDYKKSFDSTNSEVINTTQVVKTEVTDFGDVDTVNTERVERNNSNETLGRVIESDTTNAGGGVKKIDDAASSTLTGSDTGWDDIVTIDLSAQNATPNAGMFWQVEAVRGSTTTDTILFRVVDGFGEEYPNSAGVRRRVKDAGGDIAASCSIDIPQDIDEATLQFKLANNTQSEADWDAFYSYIVRGEHKHSIPKNDSAVDKVKAFMADTQGFNIDAGKFSSQSSDTVGGGNTVNIDTLDAGDILLSTQNTNASQLTVKVNGTEVSGSPFSLSSGPPYEKEDIDITSEVTSPGFNTVELIPDDKALVKGNVVVDHKIDSERQ